MKQHYIIRESQFTLSHPKDKRRIGVSGKAVRADILLTEGGPITVCLDPRDEHIEISSLHKMHGIDTRNPLPVHHISLKALTKKETHGSVLIWGIMPAHEDPA